MQDIIVEKPYEFIPPHRGTWLPTLLQKVRAHDWYLNICEGITTHEVRHAERLRESLRSGYSTLLAPNHCRYADPLTIGWLAREVNVHVYAMASWHLFHKSRLLALAMRLCGGFSINREGLDRTSLDTAVEMLTDGQRPLVVFAEGTVFRTNDRLHPMMDGVSFLARSAARRRIKFNQPGVMIHPIAIKYLIRGDLEEMVGPVLASIEERINWGQHERPRSLVERVQRIGEALFSLKEIQHLGRSQSGSLEERKEQLIERLLVPLEGQLLEQAHARALLPRMKQLRAKIVPLLSDPTTSEARRAVIWSQLADIYSAQQIESYPSGYLDEPTDTRLLETVERFEEDVTDQTRVHRPLHVILEVGEGIEVDASKPKRGEPDPVMHALSTRLQAMLDELSREANPLES